MGTKSTFNLIKKLFLLNIFLQGVPIRVELGPKDIKSNQLVAVRRDTGEKITMKRETAQKELKNLLETIQENLYNK